MAIKKTKKKPGRKPKKKPYFGMDVQDAIVRYNALDADKNQSERNKIYRDEIHKAFDKLGENIINTFKFSYFDYGFEDIKCETVAFMVMNMHKYDHTKGSKAFSYFSVVAKNYLILHNNNNYKKLKSHDKIDALDRQRSFNSFDRTDMKELSEEIVEYFEANLPSIFKKQRDLNIAYSILDLMKHIDEIENFNKKSLNIILKEQSILIKVVHFFSLILK